MMIKVLCLVAFLAVAFAQIPQTGPLSVTQLASGVSVSGILPVVDQDVAYHLDLYSFWVPENVSSVSLSYSNLNSQCSYINLFINTFSVPCSDDEYDDEYQCANSYEDYTSTAETNLYNSQFDSDLFQYEVNQYWYIGVGRYYSFDYDQACGYTLGMSYNTTCPGGSVGVATSSSTQECAVYTTVNTSATYSLTSVTDDLNVYKVNIPANTGNLYVQVNATTSSLYLYGRNYAAVESSSFYTDCYTSSSDFIGGVYVYDLFCYTPRQGDFFLVISSTANDWNATSSFTLQTCSAQTAGANCTFPLSAFNLSMIAAPMPVFIPYAGSSSVSYGGIYYYWDIPANYSSGDLQLFATSTSGSGYMMIRRDGFPTMADSGYEDSSQYDSFPAALSLNQFDYQVGGRIYFALLCTSVDGCNVTLSGNSTGTSTSSSGPMVTTGSVNNNQTTGATGTPLTTLSTATILTTGTSSEVSPAAIVVPSIVAMVAAALLAFL